MFYLKSKGLSLVKVVFLAVCAISFVNCAPPRKYKNSEMDDAKFYELEMNADSVSSDPNYKCPAQPNILLQQSGASGAGDFTACKNVNATGVVHVSHLNQLPSAWSSAGGICFFPVYLDSTTGMISLTASQQCVSQGSSESTLQFGASNVNYLYASSFNDASAMSQCLLGLGTCPLFSAGPLP